MKSLKIPKGQSEFVNLRRTDNSTNKKENNVLQNITHKTNDRVKRTTLKPWVTSNAPEG